MAPQNVVVCLDNSKWSINGDFNPTRYVNQLEAAKAITVQIIASNPESKVAFINLASTRLIRSFASNADFLVEKLRSLECEGDVDIFKSLQIANLVLNNSTDERVIKRIIMFVGNKFQMKPYDATYLRYLFRENNIHVSIVQFGEKPSEFTNLLEEMIGKHNCNKPNLNHHYIFAKSNHTSLKASILNTQIFKDPQYTTATSTNNNAFNDGLDLDDEMDEELQLALKLSKEEYTQQQAHANVNVVPRAAVSNVANEEHKMDDNDDLDIDVEPESEIMKKAREAGVDPSILQDLDENEREQLLMAIALSLEQSYAEDKEKNDDGSNNDHSE